MTPKNETIGRIADLLKSNDRFLLVTHVNPDGDAVGSLLGMYGALKEMGKECWALTSEPVPESYRFLPGWNDVLQDPSHVNSTPQWIVSLDVAAENRIAGDIGRFRPDAPLVNIDHHGTNPMFGALNLVDPAATSTAELVHRILGEIGRGMSAAVGKCLYAGLITDTGGFRFEGVNSRTFRIAAEMVDTGFDPAEVSQALYEEFPLRRLHLERLMLDRCEILLNGRLVMSWLSESDFVSLGAAMADTENMVNRLREHEGVIAGVLLTVMSDGLVRVSLRSKDPLDVAAVASTMGGGGHRRAAGIKIRLPLPELRERLVTSIRLALEATFV
jgi:bifunctional oligoribonuclease and PAP phosphatase NrnA